MSDAPKGRGRGRGRRVAATTLSGPLASASPSASPAPPPPPPPQASADDNHTHHRTADAADDAPTPAAPAPPPQRRASVKRVASVGVGSTRAPSVGSSMSRTPSLGPNANPSAATPAPERAARPVGGLLAVNSEYRAQATPAGSSTGARPKFKPNMRRVLKVQDDDDDEDVKMEDGDSFRNKRGPRAPRARQDLEMTASGPMAQGPGGPPRAWGAGRPAGAGASGAAVMAASRAGTLNRMLDDDSDASDLEGGGGYGSDAPGGGGSGDEGAHVRRFKAVDLNDIGAEPGGGARDGEDEAVTPLTLPRDPKVLRTKIRRLQERKAERAKREARHAAKAQGLVKPEPTDDALPASTSTSTSATPLGGTPAPSATGIAPSTAASLIGGAAGTDSKEGSLALLSVDEDKEAKDLKDLEEEEKKEISLSEAFDLAPETRGELYMFQFPRKFPVFTPESPSSSAAAASTTAGAGAGASSSSTVKPDPDAPAALRKPAAPAWGRFGSRAEKASRWTEHEGRIGQLRVHESGKVTLRIKGDLRYEVLPAAQPSFLQEVAILDHRTAAGAAAAANGNGHANGSSAKPKKPKHRRSSSSSGSSSSSSSSSSDAERSSSRAKARPVPPESLVVLGQTQKKFLVVPDITDLLSSVAQQEKDERDEERRVKLERARGAGAGATGAGGVKGRR